MTYIIDATRHQSVFSPEQFGNKRVDVIGAGATGSTIVLQLAKHGVRNIHVWDFDHVEEHNLANQAYGPKHVGMQKVHALAEVVMEATGVAITAHDQKVDADTEIPGAFVFLLVDSMEARKEIAENCLQGNITTKTCIETRMGVEIGYVMTFNPNSPGQYRKWFSELPTDAVAETSACGTSITVGATAQLITGMAVWQFLKTVRGDSNIPNNIMFCIQPHIMTSETWSAV